MCLPPHEIILIQCLSYKILSLIQTIQFECSTRHIKRESPKLFNFIYEKQPTLFEIPKNF